MLRRQPASKETGRGGARVQVRDSEGPSWGAHSSGKRKMTGVRKSERENILKMTEQSQMTDRMMCQGEK